jgi:hypothetical protein
MISWIDSGASSSAKRADGAEIDIDAMARPVPSRSGTATALTPFSVCWLVVENPLRRHALSSRSSAARSRSLRASPIASAPGLW